MCGRYTMAAPEEWIRAEFGLEQLSLDLRPRYNIAPTQEVLAIVRGPDGLRAGWLRWGLIPFWAKDEAIGNRLINARSETLSEKPSFREAFRRRRCLIVADGFYEWRGDGETKTPVWIHRESRHPFAFAGLWERWRPPEGGPGTVPGASGVAPGPSGGPREPIVSCTIVTTRATDTLRPIHPRMPVILPSAARDVWLDPEATPDALEAVLRPYPDDDLRFHDVSKRVNAPRNDDPECIVEVG